MYFWAEESEIPSGVGYGLLGPAHLTVLVVLLILITTVAALFYRNPHNARRRMLRCLSTALPIIEAVKICFLISIGHMGRGYLPLHLCSMSIYLYPMIAYTGNDLLRKVLSEISVCTLLPAAVAALIFPDWTMYPMFSFMNIYAYAWHTLQVLIPVFYLICGIAKPSVRHIWWNTLFLLIIGGLVYCFDRICACNYWFLRWPVPGTPLVPMSEFFAGKAYIPALLFTATAVNLCMYGVLWVLGQIGGLRRAGKK